MKDLSLYYYIIGSGVSSRLVANIKNKQSWPNTGGGHLCL